MPNLWYRFSTDRQRLTLAVHVQPNARSSGFAGIHGEAIKLRLAAPAIDGRANAALAEFLGRALHVAPSRIIVRRGAGARRKVIEIAAPDASIEKILRSWEHA